MLSKPVCPRQYEIEDIQNVFIYKNNKNDMKSIYCKDASNIDIKINDSLIETTTIENKMNTKKKRVPKVYQPIVLEYTDFYSKNIILKKYKLSDLKIIAKHNKLLVTGSKQSLIENIENYFSKNNNARKVQHAYKTYIIRKCYNLRGDAKMGRELCVNGSDFYSLEPIMEIHPIFFFSYRDEKNFLYGFNLCSLIYLIKNNTKPKNPYNRENIMPNILHKIQTMYKLLRIIFNDLEEINELPYCPIKENNKIHRFRYLHNSNESAVRRPNNLNNLENLNFSPEERIMYNLYIERNVMSLLPFENFIVRYKKMIEIREKPLETRVNELFMEIDQLGSYTQSIWFLNLERRDFTRLYRGLYDIWMYRAQLSFDTKKRICIIEDPFTNALGPNQALFINDLSVHRIREGCLKVFENLIYTGIDDDYRKLGSLHALTALTTVSRDAREAMPWLYESMVF